MCGKTPARRPQDAGTARQKQARRPRKLERGSIMKLELFKRDTCPYCVKVQRFIEGRGLGSAVEQLDITASEQARARLVEVGGKQQVPCLFIDGQPLYESSDIIAWLDKNL